jgi:hypothetical protein
MRRSTMHYMELVDSLYEDGAWLDDIQWIAHGNS